MNDVSVLPLNVSVSSGLLNIARKGIFCNMDLSPVASGSAVSSALVPVASITKVS